VARDRQTHRLPWPLYISSWLCLARNVIIYEFNPPLDVPPNKHQCTVLLLPSVVPNYSGFSKCEQLGFMDPLVHGTQTTVWKALNGNQSNDPQLRRIISSFLHPPPDSRRKGRCAVSVGSLTLTSFIRGDQNLKSGVYDVFIKQVVKVI